MHRFCAELPLQVMQPRSSHQSQEEPMKRARIRNLPFFPFFPLVPIAVIACSLATSIRALVRVRRLERRLAT
jgi:hypothetical protein